MRKKNKNKNYMTLNNFDIYNIIINFLPFINDLLEFITADNLAFQEVRSFY